TSSEVRSDNNTTISTKRVLTRGADLGIWLSRTLSPAAASFVIGRSSDLVIRYANSGNAAAKNVRAVLRVGRGLTLKTSRPLPTLVTVDPAFNTVMTW